MRWKSRKSSRGAVELWNKRADALRAGSLLLAEKPDRDEWTAHELRTWRYASAISRRLNRLH